MMVFTWGGGGLELGELLGSSSYNTFYIALHFIASASISDCHGKFGCQAHLFGETAKKNHPMSPQTPPILRFPNSYILWGSLIHTPVTMGWSSPTLVKSSSSLWWPGRQFWQLSRRTWWCFLCDFPSCLQLYPFINDRGYPTSYDKCCVEKLPLWQSQQ